MVGFNGLTCFKSLLCIIQNLISVNIFQTQFPSIPFSSGRLVCTYCIATIPLKHCLAWLHFLLQMSSQCQNRRAWKKLGTKVRMTWNTTLHIRAAPQNLWCPNFQTLSYLCHFLMNFDNFFTNYHQFWYTETIYKSLSSFLRKIFSQWFLLTSTLDDFHTYLKIHSAPKLKILKNT